MDLRYIIGQGFGVLAVVFGFISFQIRSRKGLMAVQIAVASSFCVHYFLIAVPTALAMNAFCIVRNVVYLNRDKKWLSSPVIPFVFAGLMALTGALSWRGWYSVLLVVPLSVNTYCMSFRDPGNIRRSILFTSPPMMIYNMFVFSIGGIVYQAVILTSAALGLIRDAAARRKEREEAPGDAVEERKTASGDAVEEREAVPGDVIEERK